MVKAGEGGQSRGLAKAGVPHVTRNLAGVPKIRLRQKGASKHRRIESDTPNVEESRAAKCQRFDHQSDGDAFNDHGDFMCDEEGIRQSIEEQSDETLSVLLLPSTDCSL